MAFHGRGGHQGNGRGGRSFNSHLSDIAADTINRSTSITQSTLHASPFSQFIPSQLPPLPPRPSPAQALRTLQVLTGDTLTQTRSILRARRGQRCGAKMAVLNMANERELAGGWSRKLGHTQEDSLCYSSTLYSTLKDHESVYPWSEHGSRHAGNVQALYSPGVVVFKGAQGDGYSDLPENERRVISVISVAAPRLSREAVARDARTGRREVMDQRKKEELREKIRLIYRLAARNGKTVLVLGAMGCGTFGWPAGVVAWEMKKILRMDEFEGWFEEVFWVVYDEETAATFKRVIEG